MKRCGDCREEKPLSEFYNDRTKSDGLGRRCKVCDRASSKAWREADRTHAQERWRAASHKYARAHRLRRKYGITEAEYEERLAAQGGRCALCGVPAEESKGRTPGRLSVDHDHVTGRVRGLLCSLCNTGLGAFKDNPERLRVAADYLEDRTAAWASGRVAT